MLAGGFDSDKGLSWALFLGLVGDLIGLVALFSAVLHRATAGEEGSHLPTGLTISCTAIALSALATLVMTLLVACPCCSHRFGRTRTDEL
jgi:hypothetical protein